MPALATVEHAPNTNLPKLDREPRISRKMKQALTHLATKGITQREAAKRAGLSEFHLSRELRKPQIQAFISRKAAETISTGLLRASHRMVELIDAESEHVSLDATKHVAAIAGIKPADSSQVSVNVNISPGYVINLADPVDVTPRTLPHEER